MLLKTSHRPPPPSQARQSDRASSSAFAHALVTLLFLPAALPFPLLCRAALTSARFIWLMSGQLLRRDRRVFLSPFARLPLSSAVSLPVQEAQTGREGERRGPSHLTRSAHSSGTRAGPHRGCCIRITHMSSNCTSNPGEDKSFSPPWPPRLVCRSPARPPAQSPNKRERREALSCLLCYARIVLCALDRKSHHHH